MRRPILPPSFKKKKSSTTPPMLDKLGTYGREGTNCNIRGSEVSELLRGGYETAGLVDLLPDSDSPAIVQPFSRSSNPGKMPLTHRRLKQFVSEEFDLCKFGLERGCRVSLIIPNGPELAVALVSVLSGWCAAPINPSKTRDEIRSELLSTKTEAIIILEGSPTNEAAIHAAESAGVGILVITPDDDICGIFSTSALTPIVTRQRGSSVAFRKVPGFKQNDHPQTVLVLHTSGTSGKEKRVPYSLDTIINGVGCIIASWNLKPSDVCLNMMPLFHIGGIMRNVLSPILSGGCVVTCTSFDPIQFWDILYSGLKATWYYAAPTMHHALLMEAANRPGPLPVKNIRFIANAAGGLLPVLAENLRDTFDAVILTSYGMTECMPISSPPQNYRLDPVGTSGIPVGPEVIIVDFDVDTTRKVGPGVKGNILIRGTPCFGGYEDAGEANEESFFCVEGEEGWFNTGDMGHLDENNYLYISGRSKEVINRGGETISPFEIEEVIIQHPMVKETIAFSAPHAKLQETIGAVIVTNPNSPRPDLIHLHKFLEDKLHVSKWPQVIIYMDAIPKNSANKVLRIKLAERLDLKNVDEETSQLERLFEGKCPPINTPLSTKIPISRVDIQLRNVECFLTKQDSRISKATVVKVNFLHRLDTFVAFVEASGAGMAEKHKADDIAATLKEACEQKLSLYLVPQLVYVLARIPTGPGSESYLQKLAIQLYNEKNVIEPRNEVERKIESIWRAALGSESTISVNLTFFDLGGDSLKAGQLVAMMRKSLNVDLMVADLLNAPTIEAMARKVSTSNTLSKSNIDSSITSNNRASNVLNISGLELLAQGNADNKYQSIDCVSPYSSKSLSCLIVQSLPLILIGPIRLSCMWFLWALYWSWLHGCGDLVLSLLMAVLLMKATLAIISPFVGIASKWLIVGRYKVGRYPLWGGMYLRWWIVDQIVSMFGRGIFNDEFPLIGTRLVCWYYSMMGATIGKNVKIHKDAKLGEWDLLTIGDDVCIDKSTLQSFTLDEGHFVLLPIKIESHCSVGVKSIVTPGTLMPAGTHMGPLSSTYEMHDAAPKFRKYCRKSFPEPPRCLTFLGNMVLFFINLVCRIPWLLCIFCMVHVIKRRGHYHEKIESFHDVFLWWIVPERLCFYFAARVLNRCVVPFIRLGLVLFFKWTIIGRFTPMGLVEKARPWNVFRYWLMQRLNPTGTIAAVARIVGPHYSGVSLIFRLLGAKIGKHVYWPGSGIEIVEYDLLEVGDNVTFGSRSIVMTSSAERSEKVTFESGTMIADRCVILPGVTLRAGSVLGSGSLAPEDFEAPMGSVWIGSSGGSVVNAAPPDIWYGKKDTLTPFAKAFYHRDADYFVFPLALIVTFNTIWQALCTCYRHAAMPLTLLSCAYMFDIKKVSGFLLFQRVIPMSLLVHLGLTVLALIIDIGSKWALIGRRKHGAYSWDISSYCQRWKLHLTLQQIIKSEWDKHGLLEKIQGSQWLVYYFKAMGCTIGKNVCLYPNGGDPMMTEPDLVTIGDCANIDDASVIAHINTRGTFRLHTLQVGSHCVLKNMCRLLSGAAMEDHSIMLEHTLVLSGETVDSGSVWQGWPAKKKFFLEDYRSDIRRVLTKTFFKRFSTSLTGSTSKSSNSSDLDDCMPESTDSYLVPLLEDHRNFV